VGEMNKIILMKKVAVVFIATATFMWLVSQLANIVVIPVFQKWTEYQYRQNYKRITKVQKDVDQLEHFLSGLEKIYHEQKLP
jgi:hypothetical protein